jgi:3-hydroxyacyl-[acyl-carrier-protein] dehydratase
MSWQSARLGFDANHPTGPGHFPGNPMIPGALMLDAVIAEIAGARHDAPLVIRSAKFLRIVRPGENLELRWRAQQDGSVTFECRAGEQLALTGAIAFGPEA